MKRSDTINDLAAALAKAQKDFAAAERSHIAKVETKNGGHYSFNYADLAAYLDVCRAPLGDNGLSIIQDPLPDIAARTVSVTTLLLHASGQWLEGSPFVLNMIADSRGEITPQIVGSAVTYARRYSLSALIGMASEVDDDGNAASGNQAETGRRERQPAPNCPKCGTNANVIRGKEEFGGGWLCWNKPERGKHGCGEKWHDAPASNGAPHKCITPQEADGLAALAQQAGVTVEAMLEGISKVAGLPIKSLMDVPADRLDGARKGLLAKIEEKAKGGNSLGRKKLPKSEPEPITGNEWDAPAGATA